MTCAVAWCEREVKTRTWCRRHYARWLRHGDPEAGVAYHDEPLASRIQRFSEIDAETECWLWQKSISNKGYGVLIVPEFTTRLAHRLSYEAFVGPIPDGLQLDHLCRTPRCVNPAHLEPVTHRENILRGDTFAARKVAQTHCIHGHPFDAANTRVTRDGRHRQCRECGRISQRRRYRESVAA